MDLAMDFTAISMNPKFMSSYAAFVVYKRDPYVSLKYIIDGCFFKPLGTVR